DVLARKYVGLTPRRSPVDVFASRIHISRQGIGPRARPAHFFRTFVDSSHRPRRRIERPARGGRKPLAEIRMQYMILIYGDAKAFATKSQEDLAKVYDEYMAYGKELAGAKALLASASLQSVATATTLRKKSGKVTTTDGPFAETKEQLGGYYIIDVP